MGSKSNLMHHKFVVVDGKLLLDGSFNWTPAAVHGNNENVIISSQPFVIQEFQKEFGRLWTTFGAGVERKSPSSSFKDDIAVLFFPDENRTNLGLICQELNSAKKSIDVAVFSLTSDKLTDLLLVQHRRGVRIRVITDVHQAGVTGADAKKLRDAGISVRMNKSHSKPVHHKFCVIDGKTVINGSFNWTVHAEPGNQENAIVFRKAGSLAASFSQEFEDLWSKFATT